MRPLVGERKGETIPGPEKLETISEKGNLGKGRFDRHMLRAVSS